jgi:Triose-phosphate Transporter family
MHGLAGAAITEWDGLLNGGGFALIARRWDGLIWVGVSAFMVNMSSFFIIKRCSSLTFKMAGCLKNAVVVWFGVLLGDHVSMAQLLGYGLAVAGFMLYTYSRHATVRRVPQKQL